MGLPAADNSSRTTGPRALVGAVVLVVAALLPAAAGAQSDTEAERDAVRDRQDAVAESLDVLEASDAEIDAALDELDAAIARQQQALEDALAEADAAAAAVRQAEAELRTARRDVALLEEAIVEMAVASYVHPPSADLVQSLQAASFSDALIQKIYLDARARRDLDLLDLLEHAEHAAAQKADAVADAAQVAERAVEQADAQLVQLQSEQQRQATFAADLQDRIDGALAEAAVLAELDAELSAQIAEEQAQLIARLPPPPPPTTVPPTTLPPTTTAPPPSTSTSPTTGSDSDDDGEPTTTTTTTRADDDEDDDDDEPETGGSYVTPTPPLETVQGITVHAEIADEVDAMLTAADADGISLSGSGYRSTQRQIELRRANCGPTEYDIWERPASTCSPPTATPGRSMHEQGRAIDLLFEGRLITSRSNAGFRWLADNAASYGLFNLPSEPWHWSTTGG